MRAGPAIIGLLAILGASCGEDAPYTCTNGYVLDGERCVFRDFVRGDFDAGLEAPGDAGDEAPVDASPCDASAASDEASDRDAAPCSGGDAAAETGGTAADH